MHIGILECGRNRSDWTAIHGGFGDWFPRLLLPVDPTLTFSVFAADLGEFPDDISECDAWLLTGSPASVNDRTAWQATLDDFVRRVFGQVPMVGICYGHQHLHDALGGAVGKRNSWGVGVQKYDLSALPDWLSAEDRALSTDGLRLIALHQDEVIRPAAGTCVIASNEGCSLGITQIGEDVLTFQAHPEMTPDQVTLIYDLHRKSMGDADWSRAQASLAGERDDHLAARWIIDFLRSRIGCRTHEKEQS